MFRASGTPLRIEAERIEKASERELKIWSAPPKPLLAPHPGRSAMNSGAGGA
ncbi:MAG: hypothetical protein HYV07_06325 [Deltaproteobacteria bacterium]|nr:hypothetical protein [Deltaproteobacteria bacterium]